MLQQIHINNEVKNKKFFEKKEIFLNYLKVKKGKNKYRRYTASPLRYAGGKSLGVGPIIEMFPDNIKRLISPFLGGGSIEVACTKEMDIPVICFDIFDILINYWNFQIKDNQILYEHMIKLKPTSEEYVKIKEKLKKHWNGEKLLKDELLASYYYFNHNLSYGPSFLGWASKIYLDTLKYKKMLEKSLNLYLPKMEVFCRSFEKVIPEYKNDFLYCDPPYLLGKDTKMFAGIYPQRNFPIHHKGFDHKLLRDLLLKHTGGFVLSYNDCDTIREWYKNCNMKTLKWQYTMGQGETRIGQNRIKDNHSSHIKKSHELLIWRYQ